MVRGSIKLRLYYQMSAPVDKRVTMSTTFENARSPWKLNGLASKLEDHETMVIWRLVVLARTELSGWEL